MEYGHTFPRALKTHNGIRHAEWVLLVHDLQRCLDLVVLWKQFLSKNERPRRDDLLAQCLFRDAVVSFMSCFDKDKGPVSLDAQSLYASLNGGLTAFQWFLDVRNQSIAHRYGPHRMAHTVAIVDEDTGGLLGNGTAIYSTYVPTKDDSNALEILIQVAIKHARDEVADLSLKCNAEMEAMHPSERLRLEIASYRVPDDRSLRLGRRKYQNIHRQIRSDVDIPSHETLKETRASIFKLDVPTQDGGEILAGMEVLVVREADGTWCAISLELDLQGYGTDRESACADLVAATETQFEFAINDEQGDFEQLFFATERQYFEMFNTHRRAATLVQFKKLADELQRMSESLATEPNARLAIRLRAIEESNAATDMVGSEHG